MKKRPTFKGGYRFGRLAGSPEAVLRDAGLPGEIAVPLRQGFGEEVPPIVRVGDKVQVGQIIGIDDASCSSPVHAAISGIVRDIRPMNRFGREIGAVFIESDGSDDWSQANLRPLDLENSDADEIGKALYLSGAASLGSSGFPTRYNTSLLQPENVKYLVINAVYSEPFALSNQVLLRGNVSEFLTGVDILRRALPGGVKVHLGIDDRDREIIGQIEAEANGIHVHPLKNKYPQDYDAVLVRTVLGIERPVPAVVVDAQAALHAYEAVVKGKPVVERIIALGGSGFHENFFLKTWVGTQLEHIVSPRMRKAENRIILGGIMTGKICDDLSTPVDRTAASIAVLNGGRESEFLSFLRPGSDRDSFTNSFLSSLFPMAKRKIDADLNGEHRPCIYCNYCESVCPAGLMPYLLSKYVTHDMLEEAEKLGILDCIDCGLCTYVCPSKITLMTNIQDGKMQIREGEQ